VADPSRAVWNDRRDALLIRLSEEGMPNADIAERLGITPEAAKSRRIRLGATNLRARHIQGDTAERNDEPWQPLPGMVKRRCTGCTLWYAARVGKTGSMCPECSAKVRR
jgi:hypothetical protein